MQCAVLYSLRIITNMLCDLHLPVCAINSPIYHETWRGNSDTKEGTPNYCFSDTMGQNICFIRMERNRYMSDHPLTRPTAPPLSSDDAIGEESSETAVRRSVSDVLGKSACVNRGLPTNFNAIKSSLQDGRSRKAGLVKLS